MSVDTRALDQAGPPGRRARLRVSTVFWRRPWLKALSLLTPPADHKEFAHQHPRWYRALAQLDDWLADLPPFRNWGDFFILSLRYVGS